MSSPFSKKFCGKNPVKMSPLDQGGYEGGGDVEGKYYIQDTGTGEKIVFKIVKGKAEEVHRII